MPRLLPITILGLLLAGCQRAGEVAELAATPTTTTAATARPNIAAKSPVPAEAQQDAVPVAAAEFHPPFPARTSLFEPPRGGQGTIRRDEEYGGTIELKGFVDVNGPQVILAIDGVLSPISEGGEKYGVQVISINPPQVVLQRGRNRWTASLE